MIWNGGAGNWTTAANWTPAAVISNANVIIDAASGDSDVDLDASQTAVRVTIGQNNASNLNILAGQTLTASDQVILGSSGSMTVDGTLAALALNSTGTVTVNATADMTGVGVVNIDGGSVTGSGAMTLTEVNLNTGGTLTANGLLTADVLTIDGGTLDLGAGANNLKVNNALNLVSGSVDMTAANMGSLDVTGANVTVAGGSLKLEAAMTAAKVQYDSGTLDLNGQNLTVDELYVNQSLDASAVTLAAANVINVAGSTLTVGNDLTTASVTVDTGGTLALGGHNLSVTDLTIKSNHDMGAGTLKPSGSIYVGDATLTANQDIATPSVTIDTGGALAMGGHNLSVTDLTVNANHDMGAGTLTATGSISVANSTLTLSSPVTTAVLSLDGGSIAGAAVTATDKYSLRNLADYSTNITGAAEVVIGEDRALGDHKVKLTGNNTYSGNTTINFGTLEVAPDAANIGTGALIFNAAIDGTDYRKLPTCILQTSGTFARNIGTGPGEVKWNAAGGFAATDQPLTVTLNGGTGVTLNDIGGGDGQQIGSFTSTAPVTITNDITNTWNLYWRTWDNPNSNKDLMILSGNLDMGGGHFAKFGEGTMWLQGTNTVADGKRIWINGGATSILRAQEGVGLPTNAVLFLDNGVFETSGTFTRETTNSDSAGKVRWNNQGGFSAYGGALTVSLTPAGGSAGDQLTWGSGTTGFNGKNLLLGSPTADNVTTITNPIDGGNGTRYIYASDNPDVDTDYAVLSGPLTNFSKLYIRGASSSGEVRIANVTAANTYVDTNGKLAGAGTINGNLTVNSTGTVAPGNGVGAMTVTGNTQLANGSFYEWQVGDGATDTLDIASGTLNLDNFVLEILDAGGYVANATDHLAVFTYDLGVTIDLGGFDNAAGNFDISALDGSWTVGTLSLTDDGNGTIYLMGMSGGTPSSLPGDANGDGVVDAADYILVKQNFGNTGGALNQDGDVTGDGNVTIADIQKVADEHRRRRRSGRHARAGHAGPAGLRRPGGDPKKEKVIGNRS